MARMPGAIWKPLPGSSTTRISAYDITCFHTMVGSLAGTDNYFRTQATGTNSHFGVGGDGTIYQWVDTAYRSGANLNGNYHIISAETADMGAPFGAWLGSDVPAWTQAQIEANAAIAKWAHDTHGIPLTQIPDAKPGRRGVGYHRLGVPGYMVAGAEQWSTSTGKVCPGDHRISQIPAIIAAANRGTAPGGFLVALTDAQQTQLLTDADNVAWLVGQMKSSLDELHGKVIDSKFPASDREGGKAPDADDMLGHILSTRAEVADLADALGKVQAPVVDAAKLAAALLADDAAVTKLGEAIAAGLASRVHNG